MFDFGYVKQLAKESALAHKCNVVIYKRNDEYWFLPESNRRWKDKKIGVVNYNTDDNSVQFIHC